MDRPVVMTSGNISDEPQVIDEARRGRGSATSLDYALTHDREIANRIDDSVVRVMGGRPSSAASRPRLRAGADPAAAGI